MAESAVKLTANWLGKIVVEEGKHLWGAEDKVVDLRNELLWMQRFLKKAESLENKDEIVDQWVLQIKGYVAEADDIVDSFLIDIVSRRRQTGWVNKIKRWSCIVKELWALHQVASSIDSLTLKISKLTPKLTTYGVQPADGLKTYRIQEASMPELEGQRMSYAHLERKKIIGLDQDTEDIVGVLMDSGNKRRILAIYGMGGLGKTTLATKIYNHHEVKSHFMYHAWAYISKQFQFQNVLQTLLANLTSKSTDMFTGKKVESLIKELCEVLQRNRCLVVLDDVWETGVWDCLEGAFPREGGESGSKVLLTTRKQDVAKHADPLALPKPDRLQDDESWELLKHSLGWSDDTREPNSNGEDEIRASGDNNDNNRGGFRLGLNMFGNDGAEVEKLGREMVKNCNGIPLAIVVLGGILRKKDSLEGWRLVSENISSYLRRGNDHGKSYMEVLVLSFTDLPYHLKPCFLQLCNFPEDYEIHAERIYRMWVAEGLITWPYERLSSKESLEDIANEYLSLLAQAGMVEIMKKASNGRIKFIRIHDLMRDMCLQRAATENFFTMIDHRSCPDEPQSLSSSSNHARLHHMAVYLDKDVNDFLPHFLSSKAHKYLRSLILFEGQTVSAGDVRLWMKRICNDFPWLRILDVEGLRLKGRLTKDVQKMKHLRYLSLKETNLCELPSSIGNLMYLQTLDLRLSFSATPVIIPNTLWKLERLRHLFLPKSSYEIKESKFLCLHTLRFLEILKNLEVRVLKAQDLQTLRKLKKLSIKDFAVDVESVRNIVNAPAAKSGHLRSCSLCVKGGVVDADPRIFSRFDCLHMLKVTGKISCQQKIVLPQSLVELHMESCELVNEHMLILGSLRHLKHLSLGYNSFTEKMMICEAKSFPQLISFNLQGLTNLEDWNVEKESMPELKKLIIMDCGNMKRIPDALPQSVQVTCSPCIDGIDERGTCNYYGATFSAGYYQEVIIERASDISELVKLLTDGQSKIVVLSGPAGIGKTTLAKIICHQPSIMNTFDAIVQVHCPHRRLPSSQKLLRQLDPLERTLMMRRQKCLIILPDLVASLDDNAGILGYCTSGTTILLTTDKLPSKEQSKVVQHSLKPLSQEESSNLFNYILSGTLTGTEGDEKAELGKHLVKHCSGHPQSIVLLARLLAMKKSLTEWENFQEKLLKEGDQGGQSKLYALCYDDLPPYLKDCFLYLANFPENCELAVRKLYQLWIAAGLVSFKDGGKATNRRNESNGEVERLWENVAANYLNELVVRGMVEVGKRGLDSRISTCRLHITLRNLCLQKAQEKGGQMRVVVVQPSSSTLNNNERVTSGRIGRRLLCLGSRREEHVPYVPPTQSPPLLLDETEHLAVYLTSQGDVKILDDPALINGQLKSLLFFPEASTDSTDAVGVGDYNWQSFIDICTRFCRLQVLDLEGMEMIRGELPEEVGRLSQLKYLGLKGTHVTGLPSTIQQLSLLQTLDLRVIPSLVIPSDSFSFCNLRHLYLPDSFSVTSSSSTSSKLQLVGFLTLQTLANLDTEKVDLNCVSELKNLIRVSVNHIHDVLEFADKLKSKGTAVELSIKSRILSILSADSQFLNNMTIKGGISGGSLNAMTLPTCLKELKLKHTALVEDPMLVLRRLSGLTHLFLDHDSFLGKKMTCSLGFPRLAHLTLRLLSNLEVLDMTEADHLRHIEPVIIGCWRVEVKLGDEIELGQLGHHPLMEQLDLQQPSPDIHADVTSGLTGVHTVSTGFELLNSPERPDLFENFFPINT